MRHTVATTLTAAALTAALTGCSDSSGDTSPTSEQQQQDNNPASTESATLTWGERYTSGRIDTTVAAPTTFTTSASAMPEQNAEGWKVQVTLTNTTDRAWNPMMLQINARNGDRPAEQVYDSAAGLNSLSTAGDIPPGDTLTVELGFLTGDGQPRVILSPVVGDKTITWASQ